MGEDPQEVLDDLDIKRYCCRRMIISHSDLLGELIPWVKPLIHPLQWVCGVAWNPSCLGCR